MHRILSKLSISNRSGWHVRHATQWRPATQYCVYRNTSGSGLSWNHLSCNLVLHGWTDTFPNIFIDIIVVRTVRPYNIISYYILHLHTIRLLLENKLHVHVNNYVSIKLWKLCVCYRMIQSPCGKLDEFRVKLLTRVSS